MNRRNFLAASAVAAATTNAIQAQQAARPKFGIDLFSIRSSGWSPFEYLDYCAKWKADVVHFSEVRFLGGLDDSHVRKVGEYAKKLGIELEIGMTSVCPTSTRFKPEEGTAEEQVARMIRAAEIAGSAHNVAANDEDASPTARARPSSHPSRLPDARTSADGWSA